MNDIPHVAQVLRVKEIRKYAGRQAIRIGG